MKRCAGCGEPWIQPHPDCLGCGRSMEFNRIEWETEKYGKPKSRNW